MGLKNTFKILSSNFSLTWKSGFYKLICLILVLFLCYQLVSPIFVELQNQDLAGQVLAFFEGLITFEGSQMALSAQNIAGMLDAVLGAYTLSMIVLFVLLFAVLPFLFGLSDMAETDVIHGAMSCNTKIKYMASFMANIKDSLKISSFKLIFTIPYSLIVLLVMYLITRLVIVGGIVTYLTIYLLIFTFILAIALERSILGFIMPISIVYDSRIKCIFKKGFVGNIKQFGRNLSSSFVLAIGVFMLNAIVGYFTFGVGLILTLPASFFALNILPMVIYFNTYGMNYYVSPFEIIYSKKIDEQLDITDMKYVL